MEGKLELAVVVFFLFAVDQCTSIKAQPKATTSTCHTRVSLEVHCSQEQQRPNIADTLHLLWIVKKVKVTEFIYF